MSPSLGLHLRYLQHHPPEEEKPGELSHCHILSFSFSVANLSRTPRGVLCEGSSLEFRNSFSQQSLTFKTTFFLLLLQIFFEIQSAAISWLFKAVDGVGGGGEGGAAGQLDLVGLK